MITIFILGQFTLVVNDAFALVNIFGVQKLYPTATNGEEWYMNMSNSLHDPQFNPQVELVRNVDDNMSWHVDDSKVRMNVYTSSGYNESKITTYDQKELVKKGYAVTK